MDAIQRIQGFVADVQASMERLNIQWTTATTPEKVGAIAQAIAEAVMNPRDNGNAVP